MERGSGFRTTHIVISKPLPQYQLLSVNLTNCPMAENAKQTEMEKVQFNFLAFRVSGVSKFRKHK